MTTGELLFGQAAEDFLWGPPPRTYLRKVFERETLGLDLRCNFCAKG